MNIELHRTSTLTVCCKRVTFYWEISSLHKCIGANVSIHRNSVTWLNHTIDFINCVTLIKSLNFT